MAKYGVIRDIMYLDFLYATYISTTVFVAVFGLIMAYFLEKYTEILSSAAAYAAALVVFVGLAVNS